MAIPVTTRENALPYQETGTIPQRRELFFGMTTSPGSVPITLLPIPRYFHRESGTSAIGRSSPIELHVDDPRVERAVLEWRSAFGEQHQQVSAAPPARIRIGEDRGLGHRDGYRLTINPTAIDVVGGSSAGCFYALQTLRQLSQFGAGEVPCCMVIDEPDFATRGLLHDVTRGKVPKLSTLLQLADNLAALKINQLQLYIEHAFAFSFDPDICGADDGLTPDEVRELDRYCRERFIDLVPAVATLGHMGRILSMPKYRHLAEIEATMSWAQMNWLERTRGLTLNCLDPEAQCLVECIWSDILEAFSSPVVNICGDEPWDLGKGRNRGQLHPGEIGQAYVKHLRRTHDICAARGRQTQFWSDVIRNYPELLGQLPVDSTVLHWGYDENADYAGTGQFTGVRLSEAPNASADASPSSPAGKGRCGQAYPAGETCERTSRRPCAGIALDTIVCPGTTGWKRIINAMDLAERNIATFAAAGMKYGASGLLNTDWGDHGHFNTLACSRHGIAVGAALAWDSNHAVGKVFDKQFARAVLELEDGEVVDTLRRASRIADGCETWRLLWQPLRQIVDDPSLPTGEEARDARAALRAYHPSNAETTRPPNQQTESCHPTKPCTSARAELPPKSYRALAKQDLVELPLACQFTELFADKVVFARQLRSDPAVFAKSKSARAEWAERLTAVGRNYADCRRVRNKESGLVDILNALESAAADVREEAG